MPVAFELKTKLNNTNKNVCISTLLKNRLLGYNNNVKTNNNNIFSIIKKCHTIITITIKTITIIIIIIDISLLKYCHTIIINIDILLLK